MRIPKKYGSYRVDKCPFCEKQATTSSKQGIPVCTTHKDNELTDMKCMCGEWLDLLNGKYGPYFKCMRCGNVSFSRAMEINSGNMKQAEPPKPTQVKKQFKKEPLKHNNQDKKETTITSDMVDIYFS